MTSEYQTPEAFVEALVDQFEDHKVGLANLIVTGEWVTNDWANEVDTLLHHTRQRSRRKFLAITHRVNYRAEVRRCSVILASPEDMSLLDEDD